MHFPPCIRVDVTHVYRRSHSTKPRRRPATTSRQRKPAGRCGRGGFASHTFGPGCLALDKMATPAIAKGLLEPPACRVYAIPVSRHGHEPCRGVRSLVTALQQARRHEERI